MTADSNPRNRRAKFLAHDGMSREEIEAILREYRRRREEQKEEAREAREELVS